MTCRCIYELVESWQWEVVLGADFVQIDVIMAHVSCSTCFLYQYRIGKLNQVSDFPDEVNYHQFLYFKPHGLLSLDIVSPSFLTIWLKVWIDVELVADDIGEDVSHVIV